MKDQEKIIVKKVDNKDRKLENLRKIEDYDKNIECHWDKPKFKISKKANILEKTSKTEAYNWPYSFILYS